MPELHLHVIWNAHGARRAARLGDVRRHGRQRAPGATATTAPGHGDDADAE